jgi:POT family proton-dependent oligopeptide transporter
MANATEFDFEGQRKIFGHPAGLFILFFTELWERFSYYGMRAILTLYMITKVVDKNPGLGWDEAFALSIYGWYTMLVYVMSIPGGIVADKFIGQKRSVMLGGAILVLGHGILAVDAIWAFFTGLALIIIGVGLLKPNISTMVGGLYRQGDPQRDQGFTIFYIGINVGAFLAALIVGTIGEKYGWHYGFGLAGIGMLIGQLVFMWGQRYLKGVGEPPSKADLDSGTDTSFGKLLSQLTKSPLQLGITLLLAAGSVAAAFAFIEGGESIAYSLLGVFLALTIGVLMMIYQDVNKIEKDRFVVLLLSFVIVIVFWGAFEQAGGLMNIYTLKKIDRSVSLLTIDIIFLAGGGFLLARGIWDFVKKRDSRFIFLPAGLLILGFYWYLRGSEFSDPYVIPASVFQSVNALFIIIFGTLVGAFWIWVYRKGWESSSLFKMAVGTIIMGVGFLFMAKASHDIVNYGDKAAVSLLILAYLLHTLGELCASPVALSFITKLAPVKYVSIMMGVYFAATGLGNKIAGTIGEAAQAEPIKVEMSANLPDVLAQATNVEKNEEETEVVSFELVGEASIEQGQVTLTQNGKSLYDVININEENQATLLAQLQEAEASNQTAIVELEKDQESGKFSGEVELFQYQDNIEYRTFIGIFIFTAAFGLLLILFLKRLKRLTHGAEELKDSHHEEQEGYELADPEDK